MSNNHVPGPVPGTVLTGSANDDVLIGTAGNDVLDGGAGADVMQGGLGYDVYVVDNPGDRVIDADFYGVIRTSVDYRLGPAIHELQLTGTNQIKAYGSDYNDVVDATGNTAGSTLSGGLGSDLYRIGKGGLTFIDNTADDNATANDVVQVAGAFTPLSVGLVRMGEDLAIENIDGMPVGIVRGYFDPLTDRKIDGIAFDDGTVWKQADIAANIKQPDYAGGDAGMALFARPGQGDLWGGAGNDRLDGGRSGVALHGGAGSDVYVYHAGNVMIDNAAPDNASTTDVLYLSEVASPNVIVERRGADLVFLGGAVTVKGYFADGDQRIDQVVMADGVIWSRADIEAHAALRPDGSAANGLSLRADYSGAPLVGGAGDDVLDGRGVPARMQGGAGYDVYIVDGADDQVSDSDLRGEVRASADYTLGDTIDTLRLSGNTWIRGQGNAHDNLLDATGNKGLSVLSGGLGNDTYRVGGEGQALIDNFAPDNALTTDIVELLALSGPVKIQLVARGMDLEIRGDARPVATILGYFDPSADHTIDGIRFGDGSVWTKADIAAHTLAVQEGTDAGEGWSAPSVASALYGYGGDDYLVGSPLGDRIEGGAGNDLLSGEQGSDTYVYAHGDGNDRIANAAMDNPTTTDVLQLSDIRSAQVTLQQSGDDLIVLVPDGSVTIEKYFSPEDHRIDQIVMADGVVWQQKDIAAQLAAAGPAGDKLVGGDKAELLKGGAGNDVFDGRAGDDLLYGDAGMDTYVFHRGDGADRVIDHAGDHLRIELPDASPSGVSIARDGDDLLVRTAADSVRVENYYPLNMSATIAFGDGQVWGPDPRGDQLPLIQGTSGADTLHGGTGNDVYVVDNPGDVVVEGTDGGYDTVYASVGTKLSDNVESLVLTGIDAVDGAGNALANAIRGNDMANVLDGGAGADRMMGGAGDDTYVVDDGLDIVVELPGEGNDKVIASVGFALPDNVENLTLTGSAAFNGIGNAGDNVIIGSDYANVLEGRAGNDWLDGGKGADQLKGGTGNDTYVVDNAGDQIIEAAGEGNDVVMSSVSHALAANVENLILTGAAAISGTGNALDNALTGNAAVNTLTGGEGNDTLDGGGGADRLIGGNGNDTYVLHNSGEVITEYVVAGGGVDKVVADFSYALGNGLEALTLTGTAPVSGTGNTVDNLLVGNEAANRLEGGLGNDILQGAGGGDTLYDAQGKAVFDGGAGNDSLTGGAGAELYIGGKGNDTLATSTGADIILMNRGDGQDVVTAGTVQNKALSLGGGIRYADLALSKSGNDLVVLLGAGDQVSLKNWYAASTSGTNHAVATLQVVIDGTADYVAGGDKLHANKVELFDFERLGSAFDNARAADPALAVWYAQGALQDALTGNTDTQAYGGSLAWQYAHTGNLAGIAMSDAEAVLGASSFGSLQAIVVGVAAGGQPLLV